MKDGGTSRPETEAPKQIQRSDEDVKDPLKKEAPNIATKPSMATSNTVSPVPTIQSIIRRIGTPVILTVKLDRFSSGRPESDRAELIGFMLINHATSNCTNFLVPRTPLSFSD